VALFGPGGSSRLRPAVEALVRDRLATAVAEWLFVSERRSITCGLTLLDGTSVVIKTHPPGTVDTSRLRAVQAVQHHLVERGNRRQSAAYLCDFGN